MKLVFTNELSGMAGLTKSKQSIQNAWYEPVNRESRELNESDFCKGRTNNMRFLLKWTLK